VNRVALVLTAVLLFRMSVLLHEGMGQEEFRLQVVVSRVLVLHAADEEVSGQEVYGERAWWVGLTNYELSKIPRAELEIRTVHKPDAIRWSPSPATTIQDQEYFVLRWRFEQILPKEIRGLYLVFAEGETFHLGANITRIVNPPIVTSERSRLTCAVKTVLSNQLEGLWVSVVVHETDEAIPNVIRAEPTALRLELDWGSSFGWWTGSPAKNFPRKFEMELDLLNKVFPSSLMYKPWMQAKQIDRFLGQGRTYSDWGVSIQDNILGTISWRAEGLHYWEWSHEEARDTVFEAVSTWPAGELSAENMLHADRSRVRFWRESVLRPSQTTVGHMADQSSQTRDLTLLRSIGKKGSLSHAHACPVVRPRYSTEDRVPSFSTSRLFN